MIHLGIKRKWHKLKKQVYNNFYRLVPCRYALYKGKAREKKIIISLSSYPARFNTIHIMLKSIMYQSVKPDKIIVNLNKSIEKTVTLPKSFECMKKYGIEILYREGAIEPHRKYYYTLLENPNDIVITFDDDVIYDRNMVKRLVESYNRYPECISAGRVHQLCASRTGDILPYINWNYECSNTFNPDHSLLAVGVGGVLYPPSPFSKYYPSVQFLENHCTFADDIMLKYIEIINDRKVIYVPWKRQHPFTIDNSQETNLVSNNKEGRNDTYILDLQKVLKINIGQYAIIKE